MRNMDLVQTAVSFVDKFGGPKQSILDYVICMLADTLSESVYPAPCVFNGPRCARAARHLDVLKV